MSSVSPRIAALLALGSLAAWAGTAAAAPGVPCSFYGMNPGAPVWGGQVVVDAAYAQELAAAGVHRARIDFRLDGAASWDAAALAQYDTVIDAVLAAGIEPQGLIAYEAVPGGQAAWNDDPDGDGANAYVADFAATATVLMSHFAGKVVRWEIWNEPTCWSDPNYASDPQNAGCTYVLPRVFAKLCAEVYVHNQALFEAKAVSMVSGGLFAHDIGGSTTTATDYLGEVYAQGVWDWMEANVGRRYPWDRLGYHLYVEQGQACDGTKLGAYLDDVRALMTSAADAAPFSVTEVGWSTAGVDEATQAGNLAATYSALAARSDVDDVYWFSFRDAPAAGLYYGVTTDAGAPKLARDAMIAAAAGCEAAGGAGGAGGAGTGGAGAQGLGGAGTGGAGAQGLGGASAGGAGSGAGQGCVRWA